MGETMPGTLPEPQQRSGVKKKIVVILILVGLGVFLFCTLVLGFGSYFVTVSLTKTVGINASAIFQFTLSPNNRWILYFEQRSPYNDRYNLVAFDTMRGEKFTVDTGGIDTTEFLFSVKNDCWTKDSRLCVLLNGQSSTVVDFTDPMRPLFRKGEVEGARTCSDCGNVVNKGKDFSGDSFGDEYASLDGRFIAQEIINGHRPDFLPPPNLYIVDTKTGSKVFAAPNVYYDVHFTSDSKGLYYYGCQRGGACNGEIDHLFYIDLKKRQNLINRLISFFSTNKEIEVSIIPQYTEEQRQQALSEITNGQRLTNPVLRDQYSFLVDEFKSPQKIVGVNAVNPLQLITEKGKMILLDGVFSSTQQQKFSEIALPIIGQYVTITIPSFDVFVRTYSEVGSSAVFAYNNIISVSDMKGQKFQIPSPIDPIHKEYFDMIYAQVVYQGISLNDEMK